MAGRQGKRQYTPSMEDYLEAIAVLRGEDKVVRVSQIGRKLKVKMPSVTSALRKLSEAGLVVHETYGYVGLTSDGDKLAEEIVHRHEALTRFFIEALGVDRETAEGDACRLEHVISLLSLERMSKFVEFIQACPLEGATFRERYEYYLGQGELSGECLASELGRK